MISWVSEVIAMSEVFAIPCVGALITREQNGETFLLLQTRMKENDRGTNGLLEIPAGKLREYENVFDAIRREVREETGLTITQILGEKEALTHCTGGVNTLSFEPFCVTQNLSGAYAIVLSTFLCEAVGEPLASTSEACAIHWVRAEEVRQMLQEHPDAFFFMERPALERYLKQN